MFRKAIAAAALALACHALPATAATFDFSTSPNAGGNSWSAGGKTVTASAGIYSDLTNPDQIICSNCADLTRNNQGLGVNSHWFDSGSIDGSVANDLLTLTFNKAVRFTSVLFSQWDASDSFDLFIDGELVAPEERTADASGYFSFGNLKGMTISFGADAGLLHSPDSFRVKSVEVAPVPLPASAFLLLGGVGGLIGLRRRKKA